MFNVRELNRKYFISYSKMSDDEITRQLVNILKTGIEGTAELVSYENKIMNDLNMLELELYKNNKPKIVTKTETSVKEVNKLHWWQKILMSIGGIVFILIIIYIVLKIKKFV